MWLSTLSIGDVIPLLVTTRLFLLTGTFDCFRKNISRDVVNYFSLLDQYLEASVGHVLDTSFMCIIDLLIPDDGNIIYYFFLFLGSDPFVYICCSFGAATTFMS